MTSNSLEDKILKKLYLKSCSLLRHIQSQQSDWDHLYDNVHLRNYRQIHKGIIRYFVPLINSPYVAPLHRNLEEIFKFKNFLGQYIHYYAIEPIESRINIFKMMAQFCTNRSKLKPNHELILVQLCRLSYQESKRIEKAIQMIKDILYNPSISQEKRIKSLEEYFYSDKNPTTKPVIMRKLENAGYCSL